MNSVELLNLMSLVTPVHFIWAVWLGAVAFSATASLVVWNWRRVKHKCTYQKFVDVLYTTTWISIVVLSSLLIWKYGQIL